MPDSDPIINVSHESTSHPAAAVTSLSITAREMRKLRESSSHFRRCAMPVLAARGVPSCLLRPFFRSIYFSTRIMTLRYRNNYAPPPPTDYPLNIHLDTPADTYDLNFCLSYSPIEVLSGHGAQVRLEPFIVSSTSD